MGREARTMPSTDNLMRALCRPADRLRAIRVQDRRLVQNFCYPLVLVVVALAVLTHTVGHHMPRDLSPASWDTFAAYLFNTASPFHAVCLLLFLQVMHLVCFLPMLHISQMLVGYYVGVWCGFLLCGGLEVSVVTAFVCLQRNSQTDKNPTLLRFIRRMRARSRLYTTMFCLQLSSIPINSSVCIVTFGSVSKTEYILSHLVVTVLMTTKNVCIGNSIRMEHSDSTMRLCMALMVLFSILPTVFTIGLSLTIYGTLRSPHATGAADTDIDVSAIDNVDGECYDIELLETEDTDQDTELDFFDSHCTDPEPPALELLLGCNGGSPSLSPRLSAGSGLKDSQ